MNTVSKIAVAFSVLAALSQTAVYAAGMQPETSIVLINEADGEQVYNVRNTDATPALLYVNIENVPEDQNELVVVTPPVTRVDAGRNQAVRFVLTHTEPLTTQRLKRVTFEGIPPKAAPGENRIQVTVRQNLPLIIHPKGLEKNAEPWKLLTWTARNGELHVSNTSPYVVRLVSDVQLMPQQAAASVPKTYVLPGENLRVTFPDNIDLTQVKTVGFSPATVYGYAVGRYDAPLQQAAPGKR